MRNGARSSKLFKQIAWSNCASLHLFTSSQSLAFASISKPPPPPSPHNGPIESVHLSSITCLKPHLPLYSLISSLPFVFFFLPFSPSTPTHTSHTTRFKGNSSRSDGGGVLAWRQTVREKVSVEPAGRRKGGHSGWDQIRIDTELALARTHATVIRSTHSCPVPTLTGLRRSGSGSSAC